ncbi:MAG: hypothetical protein RL208_309 [Pseudomonadota bacterium]
MFYNKQIMHQQNKIIHTSCVKLKTKKRKRKVKKAILL